MALLARSARNALPSARAALSLPLRAHMATAATPTTPTPTPTTSHSLDPSGGVDPLLQSGQRSAKALREKAQNPVLSPAATPSPHRAPHARADVLATHITPSIRQLLPLLHAQPAHYMTLHLHGRPFLLTKGDTIRLPFLMPSVKPGDVLRLNRATHIGSRDYTLKAPEVVRGNADHVKKVFYLDDRLFTVRARVVGIETEPLRVEEKTKRRQRHTKHVMSKLRFTVLKISDMEIKSLEEYEQAIQAKAADVEA